MPVWTVNFNFCFCYCLFPLTRLPHPSQLRYPNCSLGPHIPYCIFFAFFEMRIDECHQSGTIQPQNRQTTVQLAFHPCELGLQSIACWGQDTVLALHLPSVRDQQRRVTTATMAEHWRRRWHPAQCPSHSQCCSIDPQEGRARAATTGTTSQTAPAGPSTAWRRRERQVRARMALHCL